VARVPLRSLRPLRPLRRQKIGTQGAQKSRKERKVATDQGMLCRWTFTDVEI